MSTRSRFLLGVGLAVLAGALIKLAFRLDPEQTTGGLMLNLATELAGMCLTVLGVEWVLYMDQQRQKARSIAQAAARDLSRAVWVWLGGRRGFDLGKTRALLESVSANEAIADETRAILAELGDKAEHTRRVESSVLRGFPKLRTGLEEVEQLYTAGQLQMSSTVVAAHLMAGIRGYAAVLDMSTASPTFPLQHDSTLASQQQRFANLSGTRNGLA